MSLANGLEAAEQSVQRTGLHAPVKRRLCNRSNSAGYVSSAGNRPAANANRWADSLNRIEE